MICGLEDDRLMGILTVEPFWLAPDQVTRLTHREVWEWYFFGLVERDKKSKQQKQENETGHMAAVVSRIAGVDPSVILEAIKSGEQGD